MKKQTASIICALFILLFAYAAFSKLLGLSQFRSALSNAPLIGRYATVFSLLIPVLELVVVILLILPRTVATGLIGATSLLIAFTGYLVLMVLTDPNLPCSCGGIIQQLSWKQHIVFNVFFIILGIIGIYFQRTVFIEKQRTDILQKS
ncbi:MAG: MauE/DoxX family redox-associated membrane protein [Ginsengibacter sp.]